MKCAVLFAVSAVAVASAQQECDTAKLIGIVSGPSGAACTAETTYSPATLTIPTGELLKTVCSNDKCKALLQEITAAVPTECTFGGKQLKSTIVDKFPTECANALGSSSAPPTSSAPGATSTAPSSTPATSSVAPTMTTQAPMVTTIPPATGMADSSSSADGSESSAGGSGSTASGSDGPAGNSPGSVPAPAPTSASSKLTAALGAIVAATVAAML